MGYSINMMLAKVPVLRLFTRAQSVSINAPSKTQMNEICIVSGRNIIGDYAFWDCSWTVKIYSVVPHRGLLVEHAELGD